MTKDYGIIVTTIGTLKEEPGFDKETSDELLYGWRVEVLDKLENHWYLVETDYGYRGYLHGMSLLMEEERVASWYEEAGHIVTWNIVDSKKEPNYQSNRATILTRGSIIKLRGKAKGDWQEIELVTGESYWLRKEFVGERFNYKDMDEDSLRDSIVASAMNYIGSQYRWGGKSPIGIDCSGLTSIVYWLHGIDIYRDASIEKGYPIKEINQSQLKKGDLLYWPGHVAIYIGENRYIHSTGASGGVVVNSLDSKDENYREDLARVDKIGSIF